GLEEKIDDSLLKAIAKRVAALEQAQGKTQTEPKATAQVLPAEIKALESRLTALELEVTNHTTAINTNAGLHNSLLARFGALVTESKSKGFLGAKRTQAKNAEDHEQAVKVPAFPIAVTPA